MQERLDLVKLLKEAIHQSGQPAINFKDVRPPSVNYKEDFGTVTLVDANIIVAITTISDIVTLTNVDKRTVTSIKVKEPLRVQIIDAMLKFNNCIRYHGRYETR